MHSCLHSARSGSFLKRKEKGQDNCHANATQVCQTDFDKGAETIQWRKEGLYSRWCHRREKQNLDRHMLFLVHIDTKLNSKQIMDLNLKCERQNI